MKSPEEPKNILGDFPTWKKITPDQEMVSAKTAITKLRVEGRRINDNTKDMLIKINWEEKIKTSYEVVSVTVGELFGDTKMYTYADIKAKAKENGLDLIPARIVPLIIFENYVPLGKWINVAMEAIRDRDGNLKLFVCSTDDYLMTQLSNDNGSDDDKWADLSRFFFVRK